MFEYKPLEKSAKKEKDYTGQGALRMKLRSFDPILVPVESVYRVIRKIPVIGPVIHFFVTIIAATGLVGFLAFAVVVCVALGALLAVWLSELAGPQY